MLNFKSKHPETRNRLISKTWLFLEAENQMINVEIYFTLFKSDKFSSTLTHTHKQIQTLILSNLVEFMLYFFLLLIERCKWARKYVITKKHKSFMRKYLPCIPIQCFGIFFDFLSSNIWQHSSLKGSRYICLN